MIKVEHTKTHTLQKTNIGNVERLVTDAELVLVKTNELPSEKAIDQLVRSVFGLQVWSKTDQAGYTTITGSTHVVKPILISRTEKIMDGDWVLYQHPKQIGIVDPSIHKVINPDYSLAEPSHRVQFDTGYGVINGCSKIIALPEHFSPQQLQDIVDGKLKEGKCLVECEIVSCKEEPNGGVKACNCKLEQRYPNSDASLACDEECYERFNQIKLNPHVTIYPVIRDLKFYENNAQDDFASTPISVLRYISELEEKLKSYPVEDKMYTIKEIIDQLKYGLSQYGCKKEISGKWVLEDNIYHILNGLNKT